MQKNKLASEPAFPLFQEDIEVCDHGLTKREYIAIKAMQAQISNPSAIRIAYETAKVAGFEHPTEMLAEISLQYADALLEALSK